jgi:hypothetical protein
VIAIIGIRLSFIAPPVRLSRLPESIPEKPSFIYAAKRVEMAHPAQSAEAKENKPVGTSIHQYPLAFREDRSLTAAAPIRAARVSKRFGNM